ncbi:MAG: hypothetical protein PVG32_18490 [Anaerolineales bacterium]|jgi:hypothetical protein
MTECCKGEEQFVFQIRMDGSLDESWSDWFDGMTVATKSGETTITGKMDQSTLRGVLNKIWDLNLALISVKRIA